MIINFNGFYATQALIGHICSDFMGTALAQRRHNEKCWVHETKVPQRMDKAEIHLTFVSGEKRSYDPTTVTTLDILEELKLHREKLDLDTELENTARRYDFGTEDDDKKKDKGGAAAKKKKK